MKPVKVKVVNLSNNSLPQYQTKGSVGMDVYSFLEEPVNIPPNHSCKVPTGLFIELPEGYEMQIRPRSGLAARNLITVLNTPSTIDEDYRGEISIILINHGNTTFRLNPGERIAQFVLKKYEKTEWVQVTELSSTERGSGGFGSTGV